METFMYGFESEGIEVTNYSTVPLSHPGTASGSKGLAVRVRCVPIRIYDERCLDNRSCYLL
jgi:hypothetical protein